jgi:hypothetical protein
MRTYITYPSYAYLHDVDMYHIDTHTHMCVYIHMHVHVYVCTFVSIYTATFDILYVCIYVDT